MDRSYKEYRYKVNKVWYYPTKEEIIEKLEGMIEVFEHNRPFDCQIKNNKDGSRTRKITNVSGEVVWYDHITDEVYDCYHDTEDCACECNCAEMPLPARCGICDPEIVYKGYDESHGINTGETKCTTL